MIEINIYFRFQVLILCVLVFLIGWISPLNFPYLFNIPQSEYFSSGKFIWEKLEDIWIWHEPILSFPIRRNLRFLRLDFGKRIGYFARLVWVWRVLYASFHPHSKMINGVSVRQKQRILELKIIISSRTFFYVKNQVFQLAFWKIISESFTQNITSRQVVWPLLCQKVGLLAKITSWVQLNNFFNNFIVKQIEIDPICDPRNFSSDCMTVKENPIKTTLSRIVSKASVFYQFVIRLSIDVTVIISLFVSRPSDMC